MFINCTVILHWDFVNSPKVVLDYGNLSCNTGWYASGSIFPVQWTWWSCASCWIYKVILGLSCDSIMGWSKALISYWLQIYIEETKCSICWYLSVCCFIWTNFECVFSGPSLVNKVMIQCYRTGWNTATVALVVLRDKEYLSADCKFQDNCYWPVLLHYREPVYCWTRIYIQSI